MSHQLTFSDGVFNGKRRQTHKEIFLSRMKQLIPWPRILAVIESIYPSEAPSALYLPLLWPRLCATAVQRWVPGADCQWPASSAQKLARRYYPPDTIADMHEGTGSEPGLSDAQGAQRHYALTMRTLVDARGVDEADLPASFI